MKKLIRKILPVKIYLLLKYIKIKARLFNNYYYDMKRYLAFSTTFRDPDEYLQLEARIQAHAHVIEKGLTLADPRLGFGKSIIYSLFDLLQLYKRNGFALNNTAYKSAINALNDYLRFHKENGYNVSGFDKSMSEFSDDAANTDSSVIMISKEEIEKSSKSDFPLFASGRHSIRNFVEGRPIKDEIIEEAIRIAQKSPSVCNRQSSRVYSINDKALQDIILTHQNGSRGFGHLASTLLIVTSEQMCFDGFQERNQGFIDGGMFAMSLIYALHYLGLGTCSLNWAVDKDRDIDFRKKVKIKESENIILLIAVGHIPPLVKVAKSTRKRSEDILYKY